MIEMDVGQEEPLEVVGRDPEAGQLLDQSVERHRAAAFDQHPAGRALHREGGSSPGDAEVAGVERGDGQG